MTSASTGSLSFAVALLSGCTIPEHWSCDFRPDVPACEELLDNPNNQFSGTWANMCAMMDGEYSTELCDHTGSLGGCYCEGCSNGQAITWYWEGTVEDHTFETTADVQALCDEQGREFVEP